MTFNFILPLREVSVLRSVDNAAFSGNVFYEEPSAHNMLLRVLSVSLAPCQLQYPFLLKGHLLLIHMEKNKEIKRTGAEPNHTLMRLCLFPGILLTSYHGRWCLTADNAEL